MTALISRVTEDNFYTLVVCPFAALQEDFCQFRGFESDISHDTDLMRSRGIKQNYFQCLKLTR